MPDNRQQLAEDIFLTAVEMAPGERLPYVIARCEGDSSLRQLVESLLDADVAAGDGGFLDAGFLNQSALATPDEKGARSLIDEAGDESSRFEILSKHQQGGLGEVLIANDRQLERQVAVKQIRSRWSGHDEATVRFIQEAKVTGRLEHPGIVPVYALDHWKDGRPFYAMRFIQGMTLKELIDQSRQPQPDVQGERSGQTESRPSQRDLLNRFIDVCNTMQYAHSRQVLHRDIKPSNIMAGPYGETLVVDWGLAKLIDETSIGSLTEDLINHLESSNEQTDSSRTQVGGTVGTPQYMSPEQASGDRDAISVRTDVYLLGATFYQILTGQAPHQDESILKLIERAKSGKLVPPRNLDSTVPPALEAICLKAMSRRAADRYRSAAELASDVERWLADEPVSVFRDPISVRGGRWVRKHRTLAMSAAVAGVLIMIGSVIGSLFWSHQRSARLKVEQERNLNQLALQSQQALRKSEKQETARSALEVSQREIEAGRFGSAAGVLRRAESLLGDDPSMIAERNQITGRAERMDQLIEFYRQAERSEQFNVISRDTQGIMASKAAIESLGIWEKVDWWMHLPDEDLSALQRDQLRWDVYQQWLMLDGMLVKTIGTRLFGVKQKSSTTSRLFSALRRLGSTAGKREAQAAATISDRVDLFRQSETARWYRGIARFRLRTGRSVPSSALRTPTNAADAQKMGILCLISAMDPSFRVVFRDYKNKPAIQAGRDLFQRSTSRRPDHYWSQLALGQMEFLSLQQDDQVTWRSYQPAIQAMGRCISINPECCFAYADRATLFRLQAAQLRNDDSEPEPFREEHAAELLLWSIQDAQTAYRLAEHHPWVGWVYGMSMAAQGQHSQALDLFLEASRQTLPLSKIRDSTLIAADDLRGRLEAEQYAQTLVNDHPDRKAYRTLLASIKLNRNEESAATENVIQVLRQSGWAQRPDILAHALAIRGMLRLNVDEPSQTLDDFERALQLDPTHVWAAYGQAMCQEAGHDYQLALSGYQSAFGSAVTVEHQASCLLGMARVQGLMCQYTDSLASLRAAQQVQPACDLGSAIRPLVTKLRQLKKDKANADDLETANLRSFLKRVADLPRATKIEIPNGSNEFHAALLNGGFELGEMKYWSDEKGVPWSNHGGYSSTCGLTSAESHRGQYSLHIIGGDADWTSRYGGTSQTFPLPPRSTCRLTLWAKAERGNPDAVRFKINHQTVLSLAGGSHDWTRLSANFVAPESTDSSLTVVPTVLTIESAGGGEFWIDDVEVTVGGGN